MRVRTRKELGQLLRELRRKKGLTQPQLAEMVGVNRRWVVQVENGKTNTDIRILFRALSALGAELHIRETSASRYKADIDEIVDVRVGNEK